MDHHPIHLHGMAFEVAETDGGPVPKTARWPETTILVPVGSIRAIEFAANAPGDWPMHYHMTHHVMNQMGHEAANVIGAYTTGLNEKLGRAVPGSMVMGETGMKLGADPGWYDHPNGTVADEASDAELAREGIKP